MKSPSLPVAIFALLLATLGRAEAATWALDASKSTLGFTATQSGEPFTGRFKTWTATIDYDPAKPNAAHVLVTVDVASASTGDAQKDEAMPGSDWFDTGKIATATFEATGFAPKGGDAFEAAGTLSLRGVTKPVTLAFTLTLAGDAAHAVGKAKLVRTEFGVGQGTWSTGDTVGLDVTVDIDLVATKH